MTDTTTAQVAAEAADVTAAEAAVETTPEVKATKAPKAKKARERQPLTAEELIDEERKLRKQYPKIVKGSLRNASTDENDEFHNKRTVEIECATRGCKAVRRIATSDLHQVKHCVECTQKNRLNRRKLARQARKAAATPVAAE